ncbi:MAG: DUF1616 domain-containing protein [Methanobacterium sp.]
MGIITVLMSFAAMRKNNERFIKCKSCGGYYSLKKNESLDDFESCTCGGELIYAERKYKPKKSSKKSQLSLDVLIVILLTFLAVVVLGIPQLSNSGIRMVLVPLLLFFVTGYALTLAIYPYKNISNLKRFLLSIGFSGIILWISVSLMIYSFKNMPSQSFISILSILTIIFILITVIRRLKVPITKQDTAKIDNAKSKVKKPQKSENKFKQFISSKKELSTGYNSTYLDLTIIFLITILSIISVITPVLNESFIRTLFGLLFILFLPGYSLIAALFPKLNDLDSIERLALSFGLSIAVAPLIGLLLNYTPFGIRLTPILVSLSIFTISMIIIAFLRRQRVPKEERFSVDFKGFFNGIKGSLNAESRTDKILSIALVVSIILAISMTAYVIVSPKEGEKFTEFYILGPNGKASDYPTNLTSGNTGNVIIGIVNHEYSTVNYKLMVKLNNQTLKEENITLSNNQTYEKPFTFTAGAGEKQKLEFLLYKLPDESNAYRSLHLWINVK